MTSSANSSLSVSSSERQGTEQRGGHEERTSPPVRTLPKQGIQIEAKPNLDQQDKLWSEIDVLDDLKRMAREEDPYEGFPPGFEAQLKKLRSAHIALLQTMKKRRDHKKEAEDVPDSNDEERKLVDDVMHCLNGLRD
ncbi:LAMI_0E07250g1_1 [Lachancea mirantina]|uniref:LAMI_0E07250g1_1 n=1 Tax=Lachancea mirantina TaxID=1230905 RepID=A0A1G4JMA8_9SACH|nr:LAMI_0E07250g1_1 [Lachancea mirantina]